MTQTPGNLFVISAPSGAGKTTILKPVLQLPAISFSVSHTTRGARPGEVDGKDYFFVSKEEFIETRDKGEFIEWAEVHGNFYGTSQKAVQDQLSCGADIILDIDVQGAKQIKDKKELSATYIFIAPPSLAELKKRLTGRQTESEETINIRLNNARQEMEQMAAYDYIVINGNLQEAVDTVRAIVIEKRVLHGKTMLGEALDTNQLLTGQL